MAEARTQDAWARASALMALIANCHRDPQKTRTFKPRDFDPYAERVAPAKADMKSLKAFFLEGRLPRATPPKMEDGSCDICLP